jgi:hypothetical protein
MPVPVKETPKSTPDTTRKMGGDPDKNSLDPIKNNRMMNMVGNGASEGDGPFDFLKKLRAKRKAKKEAKKKKKEEEEKNTGESKVVPEINTIPTEEKQTQNTTPVPGDAQQKTSPEQEFKEKPKTEIPTVKAAGGEDLQKQNIPTGGNVTNVNPEPKEEKEKTEIEKKEYNEEKKNLAEEYPENYEEGKTPKYYWRNGVLHVFAKDTGGAYKTITQNKLLEADAGKKFWLHAPEKDPRPIPYGFKSEKENKPEVKTPVTSSSSPEKSLENLPPVTSEDFLRTLKDQVKSMKTDPGGEKYMRDLKTGMVSIHTGTTFSYRNNKKVLEEMISKIEYPKRRKKAVLSVISDLYWEKKTAQDPLYLTRDERKKVFDKLKTYAEKYQQPELYGMYTDEILQEGFDEFEKERKAEIEEGARENFTLSVKSDLTKKGIIEPEWDAAEWKKKKYENQVAGEVGVRLMGNSIASALLFFTAEDKEVRSLSLFLKDEYKAAYKELAGKGLIKHEEENSSQPQWIKQLSKASNKSKIDNYLKQIRSHSGSFKLLFDPVSGKQLSAPATGSEAKTYEAKVNSKLQTYKSYSGNLKDAFEGTYLRYKLFEFGMNLPMTITYGNGTKETHTKMEWTSLVGKFYKGCGDECEKADREKELYLDAKADFEAVSRAYLLNEDPASLSRGSFGTSSWEKEFWASLGESFAEATIFDDYRTNQDFVEHFVSTMQERNIPVSQEQLDRVKKTLSQQIGGAVGASIPTIVKLIIATLVTEGIGAIPIVADIGIALRTALVARYGKAGEKVFRVFMAMTKNSTSFTMAGGGPLEGGTFGLVQGVTDIMNPFSAVLTNAALQQFRTFVYKTTVSTVSLTAASFASEYVNYLAESGLDFNKAFEKTFGKDFDVFQNKLIVTAAVSCLFSTAGTAMYMRDLKREVEKLGEDNPYKKKTLEMLNEAIKRSSEEEIKILAEAEVPVDLLKMKESAGPGAMKEITKGAKNSTEAKHIWENAKKAFGSDGSVKQNALLLEAWSYGWRPGEPLPEFIQKKLDGLKNTKMKEDEKKDEKKGATLNDPENVNKTKGDKEIKVKHEDLSPKELEVIDLFNFEPRKDYGYLIDRPLSRKALRYLSQLKGDIEVAQIYETFDGKTGKVFLLFGTKSAIKISGFDGAVYLLNHFHPSGNPAPSLADIDLLITIQLKQKQLKLPVQTKSTIVPNGVKSSTFDINTEPVGGRNIEGGGKTLNDPQGPPEGAEDLGGGFYKDAKENYYRISEKGITEKITKQEYENRKINNEGKTKVNEEKTNLEEKTETVEQKKLRLLEKKKQIEESRIQKKLEEIKTQTFEQRKKELGTDPAKGYIEHEAEVGAKIEKGYGYFERSTNADVEWNSLSGDHKGKSFDLIGLEPGSSGYVPNEMKQFNKSLEIHLQKADVVILDYRYMNKEQINSVESFLTNKGITEGINLRKIWKDTDLIK